MNSFPDPVLFREKLLRWYEVHARVLPWRQQRDAYRVWLSEIIMQQTRVEQGTPYYERMIAAYPTVEELANAPADEVLRHWQGLGYYSRARNLHLTAKEVTAVHGGRFPVEYAAMLALKGIGEYTAAAILSIAHGQPYAAVDGNVMRVLSRIYADNMPVNASSARKIYSAHAGKLLDEQQPGKFNEALMEIGATLCTPRQPQCSICPLNTLCTAYSLQKVNDYPRKKPRQKVKLWQLHYLVAEQEGRILMRHRDESGIWKNLYDFPLVERERGPRLTLAELRQTISPEISSVKLLFRMQHLLSHRKLDIRFYQINGMPISDGLWLRTEEALALPVPKPVEIFLSRYFNQPFFL